jgi:glycosyltransferase involved in cell wall biosynthesis
LAAYDRGIDRLKLAMFTPVVASSAIGRMAQLVVESLREHGHAVQVVRTERSALFGLPSHDFGGTPIQWTDTAAVEELIRWSDALVYHVGNNFEYHEGAVEWLDRAPGVVCLHDFYLRHLFEGWAVGRANRSRAVVNAWSSRHGGAVDRHHPEVSAPAIGDDEFLTEWIAAMASSVIAHANWGIDRVLSACPGPVRVVPLAYAAPRAFRRSTSGDRQNRFNILTVGHVNPNKRVEQVIAAIGQVEAIRDNATYTLVGAIQPDTSSKLAEAAKRLGVNLEIRGEVPETELALALEQADVVACLRWPSYEAASASAIEALLCGRATIVSDTGFYRNIPDDCAFKVDPSREPEGIRKALKTFFFDPELREQTGRRAREWAESTFTADNYATHLVEIASAANRILPVLQGIDRLVRLTDGRVPSMSGEGLVAPLSLFGSAISLEAADGTS